MPTLVSYPGLYGLADNNPYGLKVYAFLKLCGVAFRHEHVLDAKDAPRGQLPYLVDGGETIGDSDAIIAHLIARHGLPIDDGLTAGQRGTDLLVRRMLDDLYWVMSYSRWRDPRFWPAFRDEILGAHPSVPASGLEAAREYNLARYHHQGIGRYEPDEVYDRGIADLRVLSGFIEESGFLFGEAPSTIDASVYGFVANIHFYPMDTPLKRFVSSRPDLVRYCDSLHVAVTG